MQDIPDWVVLIATIGFPSFAALMVYLTWSSPMSLERMIGVMFAVICGTGLLLVSVNGKPWAWFVGLSVFLVTGAVAIVMDRFEVAAKIGKRVPERWRKKPPPADYVGPADPWLRLEVSDGTLRTFRRRRFRDDQLLKETPLTGVRHLHWYVSGFSTVGTVRITLWDRESAFEKVFVDAVPIDKEATELGEFRAPDLLANPSAHKAFLDHFQPLLDTGAVTSTVNIETFRPVAPSTDSTMPGVVQMGNKLIYDPHLARTEREMRNDEI